MKKHTGLRVVKSFDQVLERHRNRYVFFYNAFTGSAAQGPNMRIGYPIPCIQVETLIFIILN